MSEFSSDFSIGDFGDTRREQAGAAFFKSVVSKGHLSIRSLAANRAEQVRFQRFLWSEDVTIEALKKSALERTAELACGVEHVLCLQDTTELDFNKRRDDIKGLGVLVNRNVTGLYLHPVLAIDERDDFVLGLSGFQTFAYNAERGKRNKYRKNRSPIEEKQSYRWLECAEESKATLSCAKMITLISDRESDIYEYFARIPGEKTHIVVRSRMERPVSEDLEEDKWLSPFVDRLPAVDTRKIEVPHKVPAASISAKIKKLKDRDARTATVELRYCQVWIHMRAI